MVPSGRADDPPSNSASAPKLTDLHRAVRNIVTAKDELDATFRSSFLRSLLPAQLANAASSAIDVSAFTHAVVPFLDLASTVSCKRTRVPLDVLLGEPWRWRDCYSTDPSPADLLAYLLHDDRSEPLDADKADVFEISPLGLYFAHEGKNRVQFLRSRGANDMPAVVTSVDYPDPTRLKCYYVHDADRTTHWCVMDERWAQPLPLPHLSGSLLTAYGVAPLAPWPSNLPSPATSELILQERRTNPRRTIDLNVIRKRMDAKASGETMVEISVLDAVFAGHLVIQGKRIALAVAICVGAFLASLALPDPLNDQGQGLALGAVSGGVAGWLLPWLRARKKYLTSS